MGEEVTLGDVDLGTLKTRSLSGVITLISRSFVQRVIGSVGFFALSVFLGRPEIGLFIAVNDLVSILGYFSDIGLAASLIQKKDKVSLLDLQTTFTLQQLIVLGLVLITLIISPTLFSYYAISGGGVWLFFSLLLAFFLASLKTIPSVVLERQLKFEILAAVEVVESLIFYSLAVLLAWRGGGVASYAWAVLFRGIVGTSLIYLLAPWPIGLALSKKSLQSLMSFGLPYQLNSLLVPTVLALLVGLRLGLNFPCVSSWITSLKLLFQPTPGCKAITTNSKELLKKPCFLSASSLSQLSPVWQ
jgi:O-antigen/teichoic acid export membrane protein